MKDLKMTNPFLKHPHFVYSRLTAIAWQANLLLQPSVFTAAAGSRLRQIIDGWHTDLPVILNCSGISTIEDHALGEIKNYLDATDRCIAFVVQDGNEQLFREIDSELKKASISTESIDGSQVLLYGKNRNIASSLKSCLDTLVVDTAKMEFKFVSDAVAGCYKPNKDNMLERLESTPLLATGVLNARALIADPVKFVWISLLLTDLFQQVIEEATPKTNRILAVSLRGSPFAAAIRILAHRFSPSLEIIDHIGPKHELLEEHVGKNEMHGGEYVLVSDFVIGGTEIKIARAYAMAHGATLKNAITIGSYLRGSEYGDAVRLQSLVDISRIVPKLKYKFCTGGGK